MITRLPGDPYRRATGLSVHRKTRFRTQPACSTVRQHAHNAPERGHGDQLAGALFGGSVTQARRFVGFYVALSWFECWGADPRVRTPAQSVLAMATTTSDPASIVPVPVTDPLFTVGDRAGAGDFCPVTAA
jgi:hypothetical protein